MADQDKNEFLAVLGHELRNPLSPIPNALQIIRNYIKDHSVDDRNLEWATGVIERQMRIMTRLVDDLLDVSRITIGKLTVRKQNIKLATAFESAVDCCRSFIESANHQLTVSFPDESIYLEADPVRLEQILVNLLRNAVKYTEKNGHIWLTAIKRGQEVIIRVRDNGIGISTEMLHKIFDLFTQVEHSLYRSEGGLGIGLALVRKLVEMHGGSIEVFSDGLGHGSDFLVRLPVSEINENEVNISRTEIPLIPRCILLADDNKDFSESIYKLLSLEGHVVKTAYDGIQAIETAISFKPEVVFLDIDLPRMSGYEVVKKLREEMKLQKMLIVAITGYGQETDRQRALQVGFDDFLIKPVEIKKIKEFFAHPKLENRIAKQSLMA